MFVYPEIYKEAIYMFISDTFQTQLSAAAMGALCVTTAVHIPVFE